MMPQESREVVVCLCAWCLCAWERLSACWERVCVGGGVRGQFVKTLLLFKDLFLRIEGIAQGLVSLPESLDCIMSDFVS